MAISAGPSGRDNGTLRAVASLGAGGGLAWLGGLVLGEYSFSGVGVQWFAIFAGAGLGVAVAWVVNRVWRRSPPMWMAPVAGVLAALGEVLAVREDTPTGDPWPVEGWAAIAAAAVTGAVVVLATSRARASRTALK